MGQCFTTERTKNFARDKASNKNSVASEFRGSYWAKSALAGGFLMTCSLIVLLSSMLCSPLVGAIPTETQSGNQSGAIASQSGGQANPQSGGQNAPQSGAQSGGWISKEQLSLPLVEQNQAETSNGNGIQKTALVVFGASITTLGSMALIYRWVR